LRRLLTHDRIVFRIEVLPLDNRDHVYKYLICEANRRRYGDLFFSTILEKWCDRDWTRFSRMLIVP